MYCPQLVRNVASAVDSIQECLKAPMQGRDAFKYFIWQPVRTLCCIGRQTPNGLEYLRHCYWLECFSNSATIVRQWAVVGATL